MAKKTFRKRLIWGGAIGTAALVGLIIAANDFSGPKAAPIANRVEGAEQAAPAAESADERTVNVVQPRKNEHFVISIEEIASVRAYYRADLRAKLAGDVGFVQKNLNDQVKKGEKLVEIDVPDLVAEVKAKQAVIQQRAREVDLAQKQWEIAVAAEESRPCHDRPARSRQTGRRSDRLLSQVAP